MIEPVQIDPSALLELARELKALQLQQHKLAYGYKEAGELLGGLSERTVARLVDKGFLKRPRGVNARVVTRQSMESLCETYDRTDRLFEAAEQLF